MKEKVTIFKKMFQNPQTQLPQNVSKKSLSDELFIVFQSKVQNLTVFQLFT